MQMYYLRIYLLIYFIAFISFVYPLRNRSLNIYNVDQSPHRHRHYERDWDDSNATNPIISDHLDERYVNLKRFCIRLVTDEVYQVYYIKGPTSNRTCYRIPDNFTINRLGCDNEDYIPLLYPIDYKDTLIHQSEVKNKFYSICSKSTLTLPSLIITDTGDLDLVLATEFKRIAILETYNAIDITNIFVGVDLLNPSIVKYHDDILMNHRGQVWVDQVNNYMKWLDPISFLLPKTSISKYCIQNDLKLNSTLNDTLKGFEDVRMIYKPWSDSIQLVFIVAFYFRQYYFHIHSRIATIDVIVNPNTHCMELVEPPLFLLDDDEPDQFNTMQKNWIPFIYNQEIYYIKRLQPLHVLKERSRDIIKDMVMNVELVSKTSCSNVYEVWQWGEIRGGAEALLVRGKYLTFFHSRLIVKDSSFESYFMGALTFTTTSPFTLETISQVPIYSNGWYDGAWCSCGKRRVDYVIFPLSFIVEIDQATSIEYIYVSYGKNDRESWIAKMSVDDLFKRMVPLNCSSNS